MTWMTSHDLLEKLQWRYAVKKFDANRKIAPDVWSALEETLVLTPSSYGLQPWKFLIVQDPALREKLLPLSWNQRQTVDASHFVVFTIKKNLGEADITRLIDRTAEIRGIPAATLDGYKGMMIGDLVKGPRSKQIDEWATRQTYIALGNFMTAAAMIDVDTCPMEGIDPAGYDKMLDLEGSDYRTVVACAAGYRATDDKYAAAKKVRYAKDSVIVRR